MRSSMKNLKYLIPIVAIFSSIGLVQANIEKNNTHVQKIVQKNNKHEKYFYVVIDVGHAKNEYGATSWNGNHEYDYNERFAKELVEALIKAQIPFRYASFNEDKNDLKIRVTKTNPKALFLAIHHDSVQQRYCNLQTKPCSTDHGAGYSLWVSQKNNYTKQSFNFAKDLAIQLSNNGLSNSTHHAEPVEGENRKMLDEHGVFENNNLFVLGIQNKSPAVLLEIGVITNPDDEKFINEKNNREIFIKGIVDVLKDYIY